MVGEDIEFECTASGYPLPKVTWYKHHSAVVQSADQDIHQVSISGKTTIYIRNAKLTDTSRYRCNAEVTLSFYCGKPDAARTRPESAPAAPRSLTHAFNNDFNEKCLACGIDGLEIHDCNDKIQYICEAILSFDLKKKNRKEDNMVGEDIEFECTASGYPLPKVTWSLTHAFNNDFNEKCLACGIDGLEIHDCNDKIQCICEAILSFDLKKKNRKEDNMVGEDIEFECTASGYPLPKVTWYNTIPLLCNPLIKTFIRSPYQENQQSTSEMLNSPTLRVIDAMLKSPLMIH
ncbi:peroxidasin homolog [Styela clava]